jgi:hypothetical protein
MRGTPVNEGYRIRVRLRWGRGSAVVGARGRGGAAESSDRDSKARSRWAPARGEDAAQEARSGRR